MINVVQQLFLSLLSILISSVVKYLFDYFALFSFGLSLLGYTFFIRHSICKYFLPVCGLYSILVISFKEEKIILIKLNFSVFLFMDYPFGVMSKTFLPNIKPQRFSPMFYFTGFIVFTFTCRSLIYFELICMW